MLESWAPASSHTDFKLALVFATGKHCSDLTLMCTDNQHLFLQHQTAIFVPASSGKMDQAGHLPPQIHIDESHSSVNVCPVFYLKAYLYCAEPFRKRSNGSCVPSVFLGKKGSTC